MIYNTIRSSANSKWPSILLWTSISLFLNSCGGPPSYLTFMHRDQGYFAQVADGCEQLRQQSYIADGKDLRISGDDRSLPDILRELKARSFLVRANGVYAQIGPERAGGFELAWEQDEHDRSMWSLFTNGDGLIKVVFSRRQPLNGPTDTKGDAHH